MAARGRTAGFQMGSEHRTKIGNSKILKHLIEHVEGNREMSSTQVTAGLGLLKKVMPDVEVLKIEADVTHNRIAEKPMSPEEWAAEHASAD